MNQDTVWQRGRIRAVQQLTPSVRMFEIVPDAGATELYRVGSHIKVRLSIAGEDPIRSYSLLGRGNADSYNIAVKLLVNSRGGSRHMWTLEPGSEITISAPLCQFELDLHRPEFVLIAGGIGITPIYGMALDLVARGENVRMIYGVRTRAELAFGRELDRVLGTRLTVCVGDEGSHIDLRSVFASTKPGALAAVCGPLSMLEAARREWRALGRANADLRYETFGSSGSYPAERFVIRLTDLERELSVPADRSVLDVLEENGVGVAADCKRGECGICALTVVGCDGQIDHRDVFFSDEQHRQNAKICVCVSRATGTLSVDTGFRILPTR